MLGPQPELRAIFCETLDRNTPQEQAAYLDQVCAGRPELRGRVEALLQAHQQASSFLQEPTDPMDTRVEEPRREEPGTTLGPYKLLEMIGEGGFGLVFLAQQQHPVRRQVAVKILKPGMDSRQVIARFEAERHALALMDHANIAKVLDAGETSSGRPYFVMELCRGVPITDYCDQNALTPRERLQLFVSVCQAVQHAHHKGLIHRDIKPSNVLVTMQDGVAVVKVIDFGIAKALGQPLTDKSLVTSVAQMIGTPLYMSPEQAEMGALDIDTRSDIYALGVLLYELLAGTTPFDKERLREAGYDEWRRIIREEEPTKPSTRLSTMGQGATMVSSRRKSDPKRLSRLLRGELDWIVMKALEKDRTRRYETASAFAADVQRYLQDRPVTACPPSVSYRCRKFARRHKTALGTAAAATLLALVAAGSGSWTLWDQATRRIELSEHLAETERTVNVALAKTEQSRDQADRMPTTTSEEAEAALVLWLDAEAALASAEAALNTGTANEPLRQRVLDMHRQIEQGRAQARRLANLLRDLNDARMAEATWIETDFDSAGSSTAYAAAFAAFGFEVTPGRSEDLARRIRAAKPALRETLIVALDHWTRNAALAKDDALVTVLEQTANAADDEEWRKNFRAAATDKDIRTLRILAAEARRLDRHPASLVLLARTLSRLNERGEAVALLRWARDRHPSDFWIHFDLGTYLYRPSDPLVPVDLEEAGGCFRTALALRPTASAAHNNLGNILKAKNQLDDAITAYRQAIKYQPRNAIAHYNLANCLREKNRLDEEVLAAYRQAIAINPNYGSAYYNLGVTLYQRKQVDEAIAAYRKSLAITPKNAMCHCALAAALQAKNQMDEAIVEYHLAIQFDPKFAKPHNDLGVALTNKNQLDEASAEFRLAIELDPKDGLAHYNFSFVLQKQDRLDEAISELRQSIELDPKSGAAYYTLGNLLLKKNELDDAIAAYQMSLKYNPKLPQCHNNLGSALMQTGRFAEAKACAERALQLFAPNAPSRPIAVRLLERCQRLLALEARLPDVLAGKVTPADTSERLGFIEVCQFQRRFRAATRLYADAVAADAKLASDLSTNHRYQAACHAALAAARQGTDADNLDDQERTRLRQQSLTWLRADLDGWSKRLEANRAADRQAMQKKLSHWQRDTDLSGVRQEEALKKLSAEEQQEWRKLWADVAELLAKIGDTK